jgi:uncharacterized protein (DUF58 family)
MYEESETEREEELAELLARSAPACSILQRAARRPTMVAGGYSLGVSRERGSSSTKCASGRRWGRLSQLDRLERHRAAWGGPSSRSIIEERELTVLLVVDRSRSMRFGSGANGKTLARVAAEFAATVGVSATRNGDKLGLVGFGSSVDELYVPPKKGRAQLLRLLRECLAQPQRSLAPEREEDALREALAFVGRVQRKRAIVFVLSDFLLSLPRRELQLIAKRHDLTLVPCMDPRLETLPDSGLLRVLDLETGAELLVDSASRQVREAFSQRAQARIAELQDRARRLGADLLPISTERPVGNDIVAFFRRRELRGRHR